MADCGVDLGRVGIESGMGNLTTDAYRAATGADISLDEAHFIYGEINRGHLTSADVFNANPAIHDVHTGRSWDLSTFQIKGRTLKWMFNLLYATKKLSQLASISASGMHMVFKPLFASAVGPTPRFESVGSLLAIPGGGVPDEYLTWNEDGQAFIVDDISIGGVPLETDHFYTVAASGGILEAIEFINSQIPNAVHIENLKTTGQESWRVLKDYLHANSPIGPDTLLSGNRIQTLQADLGINANEIELKVLTILPPDAATHSRRVRARIKVKVTNTGVSPANALGVQPTTARLFWNAQGANTAVSPDYIEAGGAQAVRLFSLSHHARLGGGHLD